MRRSCAGRAGGTEKLEGVQEVLTTARIRREVARGRSSTSGRTSGGGLLRAAGTRSIRSFGGRVQFTDYVQKNLHLYQFRNTTLLSTAATANFTCGELATALRKVWTRITFIPLSVLLSLPAKIRSNL